MGARRVQIIGAGPAGLYLARLLALAHPGWTVRVAERTVPDETFGFGVGLTPRTLRHLRSVDEVTHDEIVAATSTAGQGAELRTFRGSAGFPLHGESGAIARSTLLDILLRGARAAGAEVELGSELLAADADADLVVGADGVASATRAAQSAAFGPVERQGRSLYLWLGGDRALPGGFFAPVRTDHGVFVTHAYPYSADRSTVLIETDESTWRRAGMDLSTDGTPADRSDEASIAYLQQAFGDALEGMTLLGNRSRWRRFATIRCASWSAGSTVLIGDAAHTAHYSLGSGTKLAMEDAIALATAVRDWDGSDADLARALSAFDTARRPAVERLQELAERSEFWWDSFRFRADLDASQAALSFFSRGGAVGLDRLEHAPELRRGGLAAYAGVDPSTVPDAGQAEWVLSRPLHKADLVTGGRVLRNLPAARLAVTGSDPWGPAGDALVDDVRALADTGTSTVCLVGAGDRAAVLDRAAFAERLRAAVPVVVAVEGPSSTRADLVDALVAGRTDLVSLAG